MSGSALYAKGITKRFGGLTAVERFSIDLKPGEIVGLIGPNGAGKTTVFNLLTGVYRPDEGAISLGGVDIGWLSPDRITGLGLARTFQNIRLFKELSALDNVKVGCTVRNRVGVLPSVLRAPSFRANEAEIEQTARALLARVGLERVAGDIARSLPYGQQRRLEIARALASRPKILLLDEPAAGTNESESAGLQQLIRELRGEFDLTVLAIEHDMPFVMSLANRLLVLDHGVTIAEGTPDEIRNNPQVIEAYLGKEAEA